VTHFEKVRSQIDIEYENLLCSAAKEKETESTELLPQQQQELKHAILNDHSNICNLDEISVPILNHRKRPLDDDRTIRPFFEVKRDEMGKQIVDSDGRIKCSFCILFKKNEQL